LRNQKRKQKILTVIIKLINSFDDGQGFQELCEDVIDGVSRSLASKRTARVMTPSECMALIPISSGTDLSSTWHVSSYIDGTKLKIFKEK
jgi:hypothetical protein